QGPEAKPSFEFGQLTRGKKLMKVVSTQVHSVPAHQWSVAGTSVPKVDGRAFVTGSHHYASDIKRPDMVFGKILRPPAYRATLVSVQTERAATLPGVTVVHEGDFVGVTAPTEAAAAQALAAIHAEWRTVAQPSDAELYDHLKKHAGSGGGSGFGGRGG